MSGFRQQCFYPADVLEQADTPVDIGGSGIDAVHIEAPADTPSCSRLAGDDALGIFVSFLSGKICLSGGKGLCPCRSFFSDARASGQTGGEPLWR